MFSWWEKTMRRQTKYTLVHATHSEGLVLITISKWSLYFYPVSFFLINFFHFISFFCICQKWMQRWRNFLTFFSICAGFGDNKGSFYVSQIESARCQGSLWKEWIHTCSRLQYVKLIIFCSFRNLSGFITYLHLKSWICLRCPQQVFWRFGHWIDRKRHFCELNNV